MKLYAGIGRTAREALLALATSIPDDRVVDLDSLEHDSFSAFGSPPGTAGYRIEVRTHPAEPDA